MAVNVDAYRFHAAADPSERCCAQIAVLAPENPFYTFRFMAAHRAAGDHPWILSLSDDNGLVTACTAFMTSGRLNRKLEIQSLPRLPPDDTFWRELRQFCTNDKVTELVINSFGSAAASIPVLGRELWRKPRTEYVLDLTKPNLWGLLSSNHKRNIKRAREPNIVVRPVSDFAACQTHARLIYS